MQLVVRVFKYSIILCFFTAIALNAVSAVEEYGNKQSKDRILIAYEKTSFKTALLDSLIDELDNDSVYIKVINHSKKELDDEKDTSYSVIVIINSGVNSRVRPRVSAWLETVADTEKIILLTTYRDLGWNPRFPKGVDSITSPSKKSVIADLTESISKRISKLL